MVNVDIIQTFTERVCSEHKRHANVNAERYPDMCADTNMCWVVRVTAASGGRTLHWQPNRGTAYGHNVSQKDQSVHSRVLYWLGGGLAS